jgi:hypothetical protein
MLSVKISRRKTPEVDDLLPRVSIVDLSPCASSDRWSGFTSGLQVFSSSGVLNVCSWKTLEVKIAEVDDLSPRVMIDEQPRFSSGLWQFRLLVF